MADVFDRILVDRRVHPLRWLMPALCLAMFVPGLDLAVSGLFYTPSSGFDWTLGGLLAFVRAAVPTIIMGTLLFFVLLWFAGLVLRQPFLDMTTRRMGYLVLSLVLGPGLLVEAILKPYWGRARPNDTTVFGGDAVFTPPLWIAQECSHNCSFVSGHAALGFWVTAYAFLLPAPWRTRGVFAGVVFGGAVGLVRVIQGAHFLSDVVFAGTFVLVINAVLAKMLLREPAP